MLWKRMCELRLDRLLVSDCARVGDTRARSSVLQKLGSPEARVDDSLDTE